MEAWGSRGWRPHYYWTNPLKISYSYCTKTTGLASVCIRVMIERDGESAFGNRRRCRHLRTLNLSQSGDVSSSIVFYAHDHTPTLRENKAIQLVGLTITNDTDKLTTVRFVFLILPATLTP